MRSPSPACIFSEIDRREGTHIMGLSGLHLEQCSETEADHPSCSFSAQMIPHQDLRYIFRQMASTFDVQ